MSINLSQAFDQIKNSANSTARRIGPILNGIGGEPSLENITIRNISLNNIKLDQIAMKAKTLSNPNFIENPLNRFADLTVGTNIPHVVINGYAVTVYLEYFTLSFNDFLPTVKFGFTALDNSFLSVNYPKDGDIVSVYIRSRSSAYKPIRMDFNILNVDAEVSSKLSPTLSDPDGTGSNLRFHILAECRIPGLYSNRRKSFRSKDSFEVLLEVASDLNLGFASNESQMDNEMTWICPNYSYYDFINEVTETCYKDDASFFHSWIDPYYNLNFVNLGNQFSFKRNPNWTALVPEGSGLGQINAEAIGTDPSSPELVKVPLQIRNDSLGQYSFGINGYILLSNSGQVANRNGYITRVSFYDESQDAQNIGTKIVSYDMETLTPPVVNKGDILQKGRILENNYLDDKRVEWLGVLNQYTEDDPTGVHKNYLHAQYQNKINTQDVSKFTLRVELENYSPAIYKGMVIPVEIRVIRADSQYRKYNTGDIENSQSVQAGQAPVDVFLSGNYVVLGMEIVWDQQRGMTQVLNLNKRDWKVNSAGRLAKSFPFKFINF